MSKLPPKPTFDKFESRLAFLPYRGFPLVSLDVHTLDQRVLAVGVGLHEGGGQGGMGWRG